MKTPTFIPSLTPLRGIAAVLVVVFHFDLFLAPLAPQGSLMIDKLYLMVDLFFVLSGFVMFHVYGKLFQTGIDREDVWAYMKKRFARLYPLHLLTLVYLIGMYGILVFNVEEFPAIVLRVLDVKSIPSSLLLVQSWGMHLEATWNTASWSISVEWFLYLMFPFLVTFMWRQKMNAKPVLAVFSIVGAVAVMYYFQPLQWAARNEYLQVPDTVFRPVNSLDVVTGSALLRGFVSFVIGMIAYELYQRGWQREILARGYWFPLIWCSLFICWYKDWLPDAAAIWIFGLLILHVAFLEGRLKKILNSWVFTFLGDISYSIYMVHTPIILTVLIASVIASGGFPDEAPGAPREAVSVSAILVNWVIVLVGTLLVVGLATLANRFVENPARKYLRDKL